MSRAIDYAEIQKRAIKLYDRWKDYSGSERSGYQEFQKDLMGCFGIKIDPATFFERHTKAGFADGFLDGVCIIEMKAPSKYKTKAELEKVLPQAKKYWKAEKKNVNFLVLSNFHSFLIVDTRDWSSQYVKLGELQNKINVFSFLIESSPIFQKEQEEVSKKAAKIMGSLYKALTDRTGSDKEKEVNIFILQSVFCMFAEDVGFLPYGIFTKEVKRVLDGEDNSANVLTLLFKMMDESDRARKKGKYENVRYFNGPLFEVKPEIVLEDAEIAMLYKACQFDWGKIKPEIFGSLFESAMDKDKRHNDGMHYTSEEDILKIVKPCIVDFWEAKLSKVTKIEDLKKLHAELLNYRILDPACGSGNFLLVAYREIKKIEARIFRLYSQLGSLSYEKVQQRLGHFSVKNIYGIEFNKFPTFLAKLSLWITKKIVQTENKFNEDDLPLENLKHISRGDALKLKWDSVDVVIGNPPFLGCKQIRSARGDEYFEWLGERFKNHNRMSDYCTYWYEKAIEDCKKGVNIGLVSTNTISQNSSREASLDKIINSGGEIFNAHTNLKWSGEAQVTVSIICFSNKAKTKMKKQLNNKDVKNITSKLESRLKEVKIKKTRAVKKSFVGVAIQGIGFVVSEPEKNKMLKACKKNAEVIKPFLSGDDLNKSSDGGPSRWIVDFADFPLEKAKKYKLPYQHVVKNVKPHRDNVRRAAHKKYWWHYGDKRMGMRKEIASLKRFIVTSNVSKHVIFQFMDSNVLPSHSCTLIAKEDYWTLGVLNSKFHVQWAWYTSSTFETRIRYSGTKCFDSFIFPESNSKDVADTMKKIEQYRQKTCSKSDIGITTLYNEMREGGHDILRKLHEKLDKAVAKAYSFPLKDLSDEKKIVSFLIELNSSGETKGKKAA